MFTVVICDMFYSICFNNLDNKCRHVLTWIYKIILWQEKNLGGVGKINVTVRYLYMIYMQI